MAKRITGEEFDTLVLQAEKPVLVDFYSDTCIPCKMVAGILGDIEDEYEEKIHIYKVNVNYEETLTQRYNIMSAPTLIVFHQGKEYARVKGAVKKDAIVELFTDIIKRKGRKMTITVAGNKKEYEEGITVTALIEKENVENAEYVTVTRNDEFVERANFDTTKLAEGDVIEFLYFMGGGAK